MNNFKPPKTTADKKPINEYEALMQTMPHEEPEESVSELMRLQEAVARHLDALGERDRWIVNACISEGKSLDQIGKELGYTKTHVWRLRNQAFEKLRKSMENDTTIINRIKLSENWEQSSMKWLMYLSHEYIQTGPVNMREVRDLMVKHQHNGNQYELSKLFMRLGNNAIGMLRELEIWDIGNMNALLCKKQHDYGNENINRFGEFGIIVRLSDKVERYINLAKKQALNESTTDTLMDIVGYCVVALMYLDKTFNLPLGDDYGTITGHE